MEQMIRQGRSSDMIARHFGCVRKTVTRAANRILHFGSIKDPKLCTRGPLPIFNKAMREELGWLLVSRPDYYQEELQFYFLDNWHVWPHQSTISRVITSLDLTWKKAQFQAAQRSNQQRDSYLQELLDLVAEQLVFADESAASNKTLDRKYGYAPKGLPATVVREKRRTERFSLLPAYTINGFLEHPLIVRGSVDGELFVEWLIHAVLPQMNPFPEERSVLIIDNCSTHRIEAVQEVCDNAGVKLLYLPPYSPDLNPIEPAFHCLKQWMRRNRDYAPDYSDPDVDKKFHAFLIQACEDFTAVGSHKELWKDAQVPFEDDSR
jgi:transposase